MLGVWKLTEDTNLLSSYSSSLGLPLGENDLYMYLKSTTEASFGWQNKTDPSKTKKFSLTSDFSIGDTTITTPMILLTYTLSGDTLEISSDKKKAKFTRVADPTGQTIETWPNLGS